MKVGRLIWRLDRFLFSKWKSFCSPVRGMLFVLSFAGVSVLRIYRVAMLIPHFSASFRRVIILCVFVRQAVT